MHLLLLLYSSLSFSFSLWSLLIFLSVLDLVDSSRRVSKGEPVYAVYPDTTAFYLATVAAAPRRGAVGAEQTLTVQFQGDEPDSSGQVPLKVVPLKYVIRA